LDYTRAIRITPDVALSSAWDYAGGRYASEADVFSAALQLLKNAIRFAMPAWWIRPAWE
jgi:hypothetical protein